MKNPPATPLNMKIHRKTKRRFIKSLHGTLMNYFTMSALNHNNKNSPSSFFFLDRNYHSNSLFIFNCSLIVCMNYFLTSLKQQTRNGDKMSERETFHHNNNNDDDLKSCLGFIVAVNEREIFFTIGNDL